MKACRRAVAWAELNPGLWEPLTQPGAHQAPNPFSWQTGEFAHLTKTPSKAEIPVFSRTWTQLPTRSSEHPAGSRARGCPCTAPVTDRLRCQVTWLTQSTRTRPSRSRARRPGGRRGSQHPWPTSCLTLSVPCAGTIPQDPGSTVCFLCPCCLAAHRPCKSGSLRPSTLISLWPPPTSYSELTAIEHFQVGPALNT